MIMMFIAKLSVNMSAIVAHFIYRFLGLFYLEEKFGDLKVTRQKPVRYW
jgi:hypothetical protein